MIIPNDSDYSAIIASCIMHISTHNRIHANAYTCTIGIYIGIIVKNVICIDLNLKYASYYIQNMCIRIVKLKFT